MGEKDFEKLIKENEYLKELLKKHNISYNPPKSFEINNLSDDDKLDLFLDYFKGRKDIFAFQYISSEGKKGCSPCCKGRKNLTGFCPNKCKECNNKQYVPLDKELLKRHLLGKDIFGIYPLLENDLCYFLAFDFDDEDYQESSLGFSKICKEYNIDNLVEISQSGAGAHVWIFFKDPIKARLARKMGSLLLLKARDAYKGISFKSLDRMFPSQDYLPEKSLGFGNLIILPLNGKKAKENKTVFVDDNFIPYPLKQQFSVLSSINKVSQLDVEKVIESLSDYQNIFQTEFRKIDDVKVGKNDFGFDLNIIENNYIQIPKTNLNVRSRKYIERISSLPNPEYYKLERQRRNLYKVNRILCLFREDDNYIYLPRGCKDSLIRILNYNEIDYQIVSKLNNGKKLDVEFIGELNSNQIEGYNKLISNDTGLFVAPPGYGKTVAAIYLIAQLKRNTLIIVDSINLMNQWQERLSKFLKVNYEYKNEKSKFGSFSGAKKKLTNKIDIASIESLGSDNGMQLLSNYGLVIVDEVHHIGALTYERVIRNVSSKYFYGFTATPKRSDNNERIIYRLIGDIRYKFDGQFNKELTKVLYPEFTSFSFDFDERTKTYSDLLSVVLMDEERNIQLLKSVSKAIKQKKNILVLTDRIEHVEYLYNRLSDKKNIYKIIGSYGAKVKNSLLKELENKDHFVLIATGKLLGEGFDNKKLNCLYLASPFKWSGTLEQYVGRLHRIDMNKHEVEVHDFVDINVPMYEIMYHKRLSGYKKLGYSINDNSNVLYKQMYGINEYKDVLVADIKNAKKEIIFNIIKFDNELYELLNYSSKYVVYCSIDIIHKNIKCLSNTKISANVIIIDNSIVWYGGINPFIANNYENTIMRISSKAVANKIIKVMR